MKFGTFDDSRPLCNVYGMEESAIARMDIQEGEPTPMHSIKKCLMVKECSSV